MTSTKNSDRNTKKCTRCGGTGRIYSGFADSDTAEISSSSTCRACNGTGVALSARELAKRLGITVDPNEARERLDILTGKRVSDE